MPEEYFNVIVFTSKIKQDALIWSSPTILWHAVGGDKRSQQELKMSYLYKPQLSANAFDFGREVLFSSSQDPCGPFE
jgi:hypothetical protein